MNKVVCCTMFSPEYKELADISIPNLFAYCKKQGYDLRVITLEDNKWEYVKHEVFKELFDLGYDVIWYKDIDSLVMDLNRPVTDFIDDVYSFFITMDYNELNGGSVLIRNTENGREFNDFVLSRRDKFGNEQNVYNDQLTLDSFADTINIVKHPALNQYQYNLYPECKEFVGREDLGDYHEGNFVIHFPGLALEKRVELLKEYSKKVIE